jgi:benzoate transport
MSTDPREVIDQSGMTFTQMLIIAITIGLNGLDGFDIFSISFAAPEIAKEWGVARTALGVVLSMEVVGMALGSFFLGGIADKIGRRSTILLCLAIMAFGMFMVPTTHSIFSLSIWRVVTGSGIGGVLAAITALTAEFSNVRRRHLCISLMAIGYPLLGGVIGGSIASTLLVNHGWRSIFFLGASITACFIPVVFFLVPESVHWLAREQPAGALEKINRTFKKLGHAAIDSLPHLTRSAQEKSVGDIFGSRLLTTTVILSITYFFHITSYYFILKWVPKVVADMGFAASPASKVLVWANIGGSIGGMVFGLLSLKFDIKKLTVAILFFSAVFITLFGFSPADLDKLKLFCAMAGFFGNAGIIALYAIMAHAFPTHARAFGSGFVLAVGRGGSVLSPILVGFLLDLKIGLPSVATIISIGSLLGAIVLLFLKLRSGDSSEAAEPKPNAA